MYRGRESDFPTEPIPVWNEPPRKRGSSIALFTVVLVSAVIVLMALGVVTGNLTLPSTWSKSHAGSSPPVVPPPTASPQVTAPSRPLQSVGLDVPTHIDIRHGQTVLIDSDIDGSYTPSGRVVYPPTNKPVLIGTYSKVGTGMKTAVIAGHSQLGNSDMPFTNLRSVQPGDTINLTLPKGTVTFTVDPNGVSTPDKAPLVFPNQDDMLELMTCVSTRNDQNVQISAHLVASQAA